MPFILILFFFYAIGSFIDMRAFGISTTSPWWCLFTYSFVHLSFTHLLVNAFVFLSYWRKMKGIINLYFFIPLIITVPVIAAILSAHTDITVGASGIIYAIIGIYIVAFPLPRNVLIKFITLIVLSFALTCFLPTVNTGIHIYSFLLSLVVSLLCRRFIYAKY